MLNCKTRNLAVAAAMIAGVTTLAIVTAGGASADSPNEWAS